MAGPRPPDGRGAHRHVNRRSDMSPTFARLLLAAALAVAPAAPAHAATWESPVALSDTVAGTENLQLVAGSDGRVLAVWSFRLGSGVFGVEAASRRPDGRWG